jgi:putative FmdB family regulatory protein
MPLYEFKCRNGHAFEQYRTLADFAEEFACPTCRRSGRTVQGKAVVAKIVPSRTGTPILKKGCGGFERPTRD